MNRNEIIALQTRVGTIPDGFWGPKSIAACKAYVRSYMPNDKRWPAADPASLRAFYGSPGDENNLVVIQFPYPMFYGGKLVKSTRVHKRCAASLLRVLNAIGERYAGNREVIEEAEDYGGVFNFRSKRGGTSWSLHAWGAAIDLDADDNTFRDAWPIKADMNMDVIVEFAKEGWKSAAVEWGYDAMHFECTRI